MTGPAVKGQAAPVDLAALLWKSASLGNRGLTFS